MERNSFDMIDEEIQLVLGRFSNSVGEAVVEEGRVDSLDGKEFLIDPMNKECDTGRTSGA